MKTLTKIISGIIMLFVAGCMTVAHFYGASTSITIIIWGLFIIAVILILSALIDIFKKLFKVE